MSKASPLPPSPAGPGWPIPWPGLLLALALIGLVCTSQGMAGIWGSLGMVFVALMGMPVMMLPEHGSAVAMIVGVGAWLAMALAMLWGAARARDRGGRSAWLNLGVLNLGGLIAFLIAYVTINSQY